MALVVLHYSHTYRNYSMLHYSSSPTQVSRICVSLSRTANTLNWLLVFYICWAGRAHVRPSLIASSATFTTECSWRLLPSELVRGEGREGGGGGEESGERGEREREGGGENFPPLSFIPFPPCLQLLLPPWPNSEPRAMISLTAF